jgi:cytoskeletal protein CcmA (bactofilin family)
MTTDKQLTVQAAAKDGHYQIVCRHQFAAMNSWYITLTDVDDWDWNVNEYRIFVGTREPPMINEMNDYSVYFCGYTYFFIDNDDGQVKRVTNVNFTEFGEQYTSFLKCEKIQVDKVYSNETGKVTVEDNLRLKKNLDVDGDVIAEGNFTINKDLKVVENAEIDGNLSVYDKSYFKNESTFEKDLHIDADIYLKGQFYNTGNMVITGEVQAEGTFKAPGISTNEFSRYTGSSEMIFNNGIQTKANLIVDTDADVKRNLTVADTTTLQGATTINGQTTINKELKVNNNVNVTGYINNIKIRVL